MNVPKNLNHYFQSTGKVMSFANRHLHKMGERRYWHITQKGATVLLVAHIDTVLPPTIPVHKNGNIYAAGLDDRLGVYLAFAMLNRKDVDILITDEEESGSSTAELLPEFALKQYNVVIGLDRKGNDFVTYGLADETLVSAAKEFCPKGSGSFSDIDFFEQLHCGAFNLGIGYQKAHDKESYVPVDSLIQSVKSLKGFLDKWAGTRFPAHKESRWGYSGGSYGSSWSGSKRTHWGSINKKACDFYCPPQDKWWDEETQKLCREYTGCKEAEEWSKDKQLSAEETESFDPYEECDFCSICGGVLYYRFEKKEGACLMCQEPLCEICGIELITSREWDEGMCYKCIPTNVPS